MWFRLRGMRKSKGNERSRGTKNCNFGFRREAFQLRIPANLPRRTGF